MKTHGGARPNAGRKSAEERGEDRELLTEGPIYLRLTESLSAQAARSAGELGITIGAYIRRVLGSRHLPTVQMLRKEYGDHE